MLKLPKIIGQRGACGYAPENTIESIRTAADMGIEWVELNVKLTKDEVPFIFHDDTLDRTTNAHGPVAERTWAELKELDAGSWYADSFLNVAIPSWEDTIECLIDLNLGLNLEIKPCPGREKETAEIALDMLSHYWDDHDRLLISSLSHVSLESALDIAQDWHRGLIIEKEWPENWKELSTYLDVKSILSNDTVITPELIQEIHAEDLSVILTLSENNPELLRALFHDNTDCFISATPDIIEDNILLSIH